jgi:broad specificity phosphatase PhoE
LPDRILLVRHGRSSHPHQGWANHRAFGEWQAAYDRAGLATGERPPDELRAEAVSAFVVSSDISRAHQSATLLGQPVVTSELLRETALIIPRCGGVPLPFPLWSLVIGARWAWGDWRRHPHATAERVRATAAARWLAALEHSRVIAVTHGAVRRYIADAFLADGWVVKYPPRRKWAPWSVWVVERQS